MEIAAAKLRLLRGFDDALRQDQPIDRGKQSGERLGLDHVHQPDCGVLDQRFDERRTHIDRRQKEDVDRAVLQRLNRCWTGEC